VKDINELNIEVERVKGDIKLIRQSIEVIEKNHLVHLSRKVNKINNILWTVGLMIFAQLIITIKTLII
jgi:hypothetical protein